MGVTSLSGVSTAGVAGSGAGGVKFDVSGGVLSTSGFSGVAVGAVGGSEHGDGFCYLSVVRPDCRGWLQTALGAWPSVSKLLSVEEDVFDEQLMFDVKAREVSGSWHFSGKGTLTVGALLMSAVLAVDYLFPIGSIGRKLVVSGGVRVWLGDLSAKTVVDPGSRVGGGEPLEVVDFGLVGDVDSIDGSVDSFAEFLRVIAAVGPVVKKCDVMSDPGRGSVMDFLVSVMNSFRVPEPIDQRPGFVFDLLQMRHVFLKKEKVIMDHPPVDLGSCVDGASHWYLSAPVVDGKIRVRMGAADEFDGWLCWYLGSGFKGVVDGFDFGRGETLAFPEYGGICFWFKRGIDVQVSVAKAYMLICLVKEMDAEQYSAALEHCGCLHLN